MKPATRYATYGGTSYHLWVTGRAFTLCGQLLEDAARYDEPPADYTKCGNCQRAKDDSPILSTITPTEEEE